MGEEPRRGVGRLVRGASQALQQLDEHLEERDRAAGPGLVEEMARSPVPPGGKPGLRRGMSQRLLQMDSSGKPGLRRARSQELPDTAAGSQSDIAPPVVLAAEPAATPQKLPKHLQVLVAPIAGMCAGALEISTLWPMEWAKVQIQLHKSDPKWSVVAEARRLGLGLYKGLPSMLVGVPMQGAVRFSTLDVVKAALVEPGKQAGPATNLAAGLLAGTLEATLVVTPVETVTRRSTLPASPPRTPPHTTP